MTVLLRLIDCDETSLSRRVAAAQADLPQGCVVTRFTYWYTSRPPVHEALVLAPAA
jgi:hypothetical protein